MKTIGFFILSILLFSMVSCSTGDKEVEEEGMEEVAAEEMDEDYELEADEEDLVDEGEELIKEEGEELEEDIDEFASAEADEIEEEVRAQSQVAVSSASGKYKVKKNDTLMWIAFRLYGDYGRWRELQNINGGIHPEGLSAGQTIRYRVPSRPFVWNPKGNPYLIKQDDTLGLISKDVYGKQERWRDIYNNNRPMIKDPNLIFAGFTLYYIPDRELASE